jgi:dTDP-4-dehydrorhamnose 3,5-epimerase
MIEVMATDLPDIKLIRPPRFFDARGFFCELFNERAFAAAGIEDGFVQDNVSLSTAPGTVRGLHYQLAPFAQAKLLAVLRGSIFDVAVDIRRDSPSFGRHVATRLSVTDGLLLLVPRGFAHGFATLEPDTMVLYKVGAPYSPEHERGILWSDPALGIAWPVAMEKAELSPRDRQWPPLAAARDLM